MKFRKKPVVVEAVQNTGEWGPIFQWLMEVQSNNGMVFQPGENPPITRNPDRSLNIHTLEGTMRADVNDWVIRETKGELYPCKPDIFGDIYEVAE